MRAGRRLGIDVGDVRIGVAVCDPDGLLATPVETVPAGEGALARLRELALENEVLECIVGLPRSLSGAEGPAAKKVRAFASELKKQVHPISVRLFDERLTTVSAEQSLAQSKKKKSAKRAVIDQAAAVVILQAALDAERVSGLLPQEVT